MGWIESSSSTLLGRADSPSAAGVSGLRRVLASCLASEGEAGRGVVVSSREDSGSAVPPALEDGGGGGNCRPLPGKKGLVRGGPACRAEARFGETMGDAVPPGTRLARSGTAELRISTDPGGAPASLRSPLIACVLATVRNDPAEGADPAERDPSERFPADWPPLEWAPAESELMERLPIDRVCVGAAEPGGESAIWLTEMALMSESISDEAFEAREPVEPALVVLLRRSSAALVGTASRARCGLSTSDPLLVVEPASDGGRRKGKMKVNFDP